MLQSNVLLDVNHMTHIYPDLEWYTKLSNDQQMSPRCPYANVHRCYRYYCSLYLLGSSGITTEIEKEKNDELTNYWAGSDLIPVIAEHDTGVASSNDKLISITNFCPEVGFDIFGLFAESFHKYADEIDKDCAHSQLSEKASDKDWRWQWAYIKPMHFKSCPVYSQILTTQEKPSIKEEVSKSEEKEIVTLKPSIFGVGIDLKALFKKWHT